MKGAGLVANECPKNIIFEGMYSCRLCNMRTSYFALYNDVFDLKYYLLCGRLSKSESRPVVGFRPLVTSAGVFVENLNTLFPNSWSLKKVFRAANQAIGLFGFITLTWP